MLISKTNIVDNIIFKVSFAYYCRCSVRPLDDKHSSQIVFEKGEPKKVQFLFCLVLSKLRFMKLLK